MIEARIQSEAAELAQRWAEDSRWAGILRTYEAEDAVRLRGSVTPEHTLARLGAERLWQLLADEDYVAALGALSGGQVVQMVRAGLKAVYLSGWQVAADANLAGHTYPDQSLYPANSVPAIVRRLNNALLRCDQIDWAESRNGTDWLARSSRTRRQGRRSAQTHSSVMKRCRVGRSGRTFRDQLASGEKCGHLGGGARPDSQLRPHVDRRALAADVLGVPTVLIADDA